MKGNNQRRDEELNYKKVSEWKFIIIQAFKIEDYIIKNLNKNLEKLQILCEKITKKEKEFIIQYSELWLDTAQHLKLIKNRVEAVERLINEFKPTELIQKSEYGRK